MNILLTAFEAFGGEEVNPSKELLKNLPDSLDNINLYKLYIPVSYERSARALVNCLKYDEFDACFMLGQAGGKANILLENTAHKQTDLNLLDSDGKALVTKAIDEKAPSYYKSNINMENLVNILKKEGINAQISNDAGRYVCNYLYFRCMLCIDRLELKTKAGFIHLPYLPQQVINTGKPSMDLEITTKAMEICIKHALI